MEQARTQIPAGNASPYHVVLKEYRLTLNRIAELRMKQLAHLVA